MNREAELDQTAMLSRRIVEATGRLFSGHPIAVRIQQACADYDQQCHDILFGRGLHMLTIAIIGTKGQGKTWTARQMVLNEETRRNLPSGVLANEATTRLYWIGSMPPESMNLAHEKYVYCPPSEMLDLELPYMLLDTPGTTDANHHATEIASAALSLSPIQLLVIRRDQLRASTTSPLAERSEGVICIPVITSIPLQEWNETKPRLSDSRESVATSPALESDIHRFIKLIRDSAPQSQVLEPILVEDFEATGDEQGAADRFRHQLRIRLQGHPLDALARTKSNRLSAAGERLKHQVHRLIQAETPQLSPAVLSLQDEARNLPRRAIESVIGSPIVLETAIRARLRTQIVADTSPVCFPYRTTLSLLSLTHGAWDRLILAMTGSIPSVFGTFVAWAKNVQQSRKAEWDLQQGLRERLNGQVLDQLTPIQTQFHRALAHIRGQDSLVNETPRSQTVRLNGIDEFQSRSQMLFEQMLQRYRTSRWLLFGIATLGMLLFWGLLAGPIFSIYRQYISASIGALATDQGFVDTYHHPSLPLLMSSTILSFVPMLLYAMVTIAWLLRRSKIERLSGALQTEHHVLVNELQQNGILCLEFEDPLLEQAQFLLALDRKRTE